LAWGSGTRSRCACSLRDEAGDAFERAAGEPICGASLYRRFVTAAKRAGLPVLRFHDLRHSFSTHTIRVFNIYEVQHMMGHRHITTTKRYLDYAPDANAAAKLSGLWRSDEPGENVVGIRPAA
jgi:integrase